MNKSKNFLNVEKIRNDFPCLAGNPPLIYFDGGATSLKPSPVIEEVCAYYRNYCANIHRGLYHNSLESSRKYEETRLKTARFIGAESEREIVFTSNTTMSVNIAAMNLPRITKDPSRKKILLPLSEHHANILPWMRLREQGFRVEFINLTPDDRLDMEDYERKLTPDTAIVSAACASNVSGVMNPLSLMARMAHRAGALFMIDGAQGAAHLPMNVKEMEIDLGAFSGHKMYAPPGVGFLYARMEILEKMEPLLLGGGIVEKVTTEGYKLTAFPGRMEAGTPDIAGVIGLGAAIDYLENIGMENIRLHETALLKYALDKMPRVRGITLYGPEGIEDRIGIVSFNMDGWDSSDLPLVLDRKGNIAVRSGMHCAEPYVGWLCSKGVIRVSFSLFNDEWEIDRMVEILEDL